jgi:hypothetical protein
MQTLQLLQTHRSHRALWDLAVLVFLLPSLVFARPAITNLNFHVIEGQPFNLTWSGAVGGVTVRLLTGSAMNLTTVRTLASKALAASLCFRLGS